MLLTILLGKTIQKLSRLRGHGGSALPGLVIERLQPTFIRNILSSLPYGTVVITGTNGKTTTTKIVAQLLEGQGIKVFRNHTGSNFIRGIISSIIANIQLNGRFDYDIAILELDEAHAVKFAASIPYAYALLLNIQPDQIDRFKSTAQVAKLLATVASRAEKSVIINREDPLLTTIPLENPVYFGLASQLLPALALEKTPHQKTPALVTLENYEAPTATFKIANLAYSSTLQLKGIYNAYNAAAALALVKTILPSSSNPKLIASLESISPAFGRGETIHVGSQTIELYLVKNPTAFQLNLTAFASPDHDFMIAINDQPADGRDVSWLKQVDFSSLKTIVVASGTRATYLAKILRTHQLTLTHIEPQLKTALKLFLKNSSRQKRIFATYTAMLAIRKYLTGKSLL